NISLQDLILHTAIKVKATWKTLHNLLKDISLIQRFLRLNIKVKKLAQQRLDNIWKMEIFRLSTRYWEGILERQELSLKVISVVIRSGIPPQILTFMNIQCFLHQGFMLSQYISMVIYMQAWLR